MKVTVARFPTTRRTADRKRLEAGFARDFHLTIIHTIDRSAGPVWTAGERGGGIRNSDGSGDVDCVYVVGFESAGKISVEDAGKRLGFTMKGAWKGACQPSNDMNFSPSEYLTLKL